VSKENPKKPKPAGKKPSAKKGSKDKDVLRRPRGKKTPAAKKPPAETPQAEAPEAPTEDPQTMTVTLTVFGSGDTPIELTEGATVSDLLIAAGLSGKDGTVLISSKPAGLEDQLPIGAAVVFATKIKGGRF
jgi:hypothetical protein